MIVKCSKKLKVCPFCGQQAVLDQNESELAGHGRYYALGCETKDCRGSVYREVAYHPEGMVSREIAAWNTRK